jgi:signal transduction histidine kinase
MSLNEPPTNDDDELKSITENLYKQNLEIAERNKTLSLLGKLYDISIQTLPPAKLAEQLTHDIQTDLSFERVGILVYDKSNDTLTALGSSESERFHSARASANTYFDKAVFEKVHDITFFNTVFESRTMAHLEDLTQLWGENVTPETLQRIQEESHTKSVLVYPLLAGDQVIGILSLIINRTYEELASFEKETILSFINVISIALDRSQIYEQLTITNDKLEKANEQQVILIHFITHQLKGFVTKSRNIFSLLIEGDFGVLPDTMKPMVEEGFRSDTKGAETIQEILNAANIKSGKVTYNMAPFDLKALIEEISNDLKPTATTKGLDLKLNLGESLEYNGDKAQLTNALKNLIDNSIKYTPSGSVEVILAKKEDTIHFEIKDTGVGITPEDMQNLFTEGGHGKESQKINVESTGFGLYIVKNIIDGHGGKIWAESEGAGKGSRFIIELPLK